MNNVQKIKYYTDGACSVNSGFGGYAYVKTNNTDGQEETVIETFQCGEKDTTNNRMEVKAIIRSLEDIIFNYCSGPNKYEIEINSDSQYCINSITKWLDGWAKKNYLKDTPGKNLKNPDLWGQVFELKKEIKSCDSVTLSFKWIRGHDTNQFNNAADSLAVKARVEIAKKENPE